jgi:hypothetical protein
MTDVNNQQMTHQPEPGMTRIDPWVRLHYNELLLLQPTHLYSSFDDDVAEEFAVREPSSAGVTEWAVDGSRKLSFGWDWYWDANSRLMLANWRQLRTNVLLVDDSGRDLSAEETYPYVEQLMSRCQWQQATCQMLGLVGPGHEGA